MNDVDDNLRGTIRDLAGEIQMRPDLAATAMASGRRLRLRRRLATTFVAGAVAASVAIGTPHLLHAVAGGTAVSPGTSTEPATLPAAAGVPGAVQRPDLVGTDGGVLHFDVDLTAIPHLDGTSWMTGSGNETLSIFRSVEGPSQVVVLVSPPGRPTTFEQDEPAESRQLTVGGRPATLARFEPEVSGGDVPPSRRRHLIQWRLSWEPVDGLPVAITGGDADIVTVVAGALRFDRARRCVQPVRVTGMPAGAKLSSCTVHLDAAGAFVSSYFDATFPGPLRHMGITCGKGRGDGRLPNRTVDGRPAVWVDDERSLTVEGVGGCPALQVAGDTEAEVTALLRKAEFVGDPRKPDTWPIRPVS
jgi:hypothetical protein